MKYIYLPLGFLSLALGLAGIFLPVLPTTPFLLLSAALFFRSSPSAYQWLMNHRLLGPYIRDFRESRAIPLRAKIIALSLLWLTSLHCIFLVFDVLAQGDDARHRRRSDPLSLFLQNQTK